MEDLTLRILSALSRNLGRALSIQDLTREIKRLYGTAHYANTYNAVRPLQKLGLLQLAHLGRTSSLTLNFGSYLLIERLAEIEHRKIGMLLEGNRRAEATLAELDRCLRDTSALFALIMDAKRNLRLNRIEILICTAEGAEAKTAQALEGLAKQLAIRIDAIPLSEPQIMSLLSSFEQNPLQEMLATGAALYNPQALWAAIRRAELEGRTTRACEPTDPATLPLGDLHYNLGRFGFPLLGSPPEGRNFCIEFAATAALLRHDARLREGAGVILSKNAFNAQLLAFLATKYGLRDELSSLISAGPTTPNTKRLLSLLPKTRANAARAPLAKTRETYHAA